MKKTILTFVIINLFIINIFAQNRRDSIDVLNYRIDLIIMNFSTKAIEGNTTVTLQTVFDNTQKIKLDLLGMDISSIEINEKKHKKWTYNDSVLTINFKKPIEKNTILNITVYYSGNPKKDSYWGGFYFSDKNAYNMGVGMTAIPHCFGRVWFPCNDNFTDKATYDYYLMVDKNKHAVCGGKEIPRKVVFEDKSVYRWYQKNPIPTYLASVAIADYEVIELSYKGLEREIPIQIFTFKGKKELAEKSTVNLEKTMRVFEELFGAYKWERIGFVEVDFSSGAMEHAENISITNKAFDGTLSRESLIYHELSHSWFGNLVTCKSAKDMWLNEGWASYCESIFFEYVYDNEKFKSYNRERHFTVLHQAHKNDNGYRSVANMDISETYGTTVYKKGADVIHTLRNYIGDELFFPAVRTYLEKFAFKNANTEDFKQVLEDETDIDLDDFFDFWVYSKGFNFFEIEKIDTKKIEDFYELTVYVKQSLKETENYANSNKIEITFMDEKFNMQNRIIEFSGKSGKQTYKIPFEPKLVMCDIFEKTTDATIDKYLFLTKPEIYKYNECLFDANITKITDTTFLRITSNCIAPENSDIKGYVIHKSYYWTVEGIWNSDFEATGLFYITKLMDNNFTKLYKAKEYILMYRKNTNETWKQIESINKSQYLEAKLENGQYVIAVKTYE
jgi:aminopeptidase N